MQQFEFNHDASLMDRHCTDQPETGCQALLVSIKTQLP